jgi:hypothetical protein
MITVVEVSGTRTGAHMANNIHPPVESEPDSSCPALSSVSLASDLPGPPEKSPCLRFLNPRPRTCVCFETARFCGRREEAEEEEEEEE